VKKLLLSTALLLGLCAPALAQVNTVPQVGLITGVLKNPTYSASAVGLVPGASATDIFCISPGTSKNIYINKVVVSGTAGTAITTPVTLIRRTVADTGGTPATSFALPVATPFILSDPASTATLISYTANPTLDNAANAIVAAATVNFPVTASAGSQPYTFQFGTGSNMFNRSLILQKNTTQQLCLGLFGVSVSSGVLTISMEWEELP
jgi:hypothetical protein